MPQIGTESPSASSKEVSRNSSGDGWLKTHWSAIFVCAIVVIAFLLRTVFAYGISADNNFALSGGSGAQYHLHVVESILNGTYAIGTDAAVNYPVGGLSICPPLYDFIAAGIASFTSASAAMGGLNPVIGALTCIPVYLVTKEMFGNKTIGVISALIFAFLPLPIASSAFSNGTEFALAAFLVAFMSLFMFRAAKAIDSDGRKSALVNAAVAGVFMGLAALTWTGFGVLFAVAAGAMLLQMAVYRVQNKPMVGAYMTYALMMAIALAMSAVYYLPAGLWDAAFSGPCILAVFALAFGAAFLALRNVSWAVSIPALIIVFLAALVVLFFAANDLFSDFVGKNSMYTAMMGNVVVDRVSMSNVASYYGWLTMWLPFCLAVYETYVLIRKDRSSSRLFITVWLYVLFFAVWDSYGTAAAIGSVFGVASGAALYKFVKYTDVRGWIKDVRTAGITRSAKKFFSLPFAAILIVALLVFVPNVVYGLDAGVPTNDSDNVLYNGNTKFTIKEGDSYPLGQIWDSQSVDMKSGALAGRMDYTYDAVAYGDFDTVGDNTGKGASAISHILLSDGPSGAVASMMMRIMTASGIDKFAADFDDHSVYDAILTYSKDKNALYKELEENAEYYGKLKSNVSCENALYFASVKEITENMSFAEICSTYDKVCARSGDKISYVLLDPTLVPVQYGGNDQFSGIAYFADYALDSYGAPSEFFTYNPYYGYAVYTDDMYDTFFWKAYIGPSASEAGESSSYGYLYDLSMSDGTIAANPVEMAGFDLNKWVVRYTSEKSPKDDSDWKYIDYSEAIAKQKSEGGIINYLGSYMLYEYRGFGSAVSTINGSVVTDSGAGADGIRAELYTHNSTAGKDILTSVDTVRNGKYVLAVPTGASGYKVVLKSGDVEIATFRDSVPAVYTIPTVSVSGQVDAGDSAIAGVPMKLEFQNSSVPDAKYVVESDDGSFSVSNVMEGQYDVTIYDKAASKLATSTLTVAADGDKSVSGLVLTPTTKTITLTVKDAKGALINGGTAVATNISSGVQYSAPIKDGTAVITALPGTYTIQLTDGYITVSTATYNISSSNRTANITAYEAAETTLSNASTLTFSAGDYSTVTYDGGSKVSLPRSLATDKMQYTVYGLDGSKLLLGTYDGTLSVSESASVKVTGTLKDADGVTSGTIVFQNSSKQSVSATAEEDGKFTVYLPAGTYTVFANDGSDKVAVTSATVSADSDIGDVTMDEGRRISAYLRYASGTSSGNVGLAYVTSSISFTYKDAEYVMYGMTNSSGLSNFFVPDNVECKVSFNGGSIENKYFHGPSATSTVAAGESNTSSYVTLSKYSATSTPVNYVKPVSVTSAYEMTLDPYSTGDEIKFAAGETKEIAPGQYTAKVLTSGKYFNGTVYVYPGESEFTGLDVVDAHSVAITKADSDVLTIVPNEDGGEYYQDGSNYFFKDGYVYYLSSVASAASDANVKYATVDLDKGTAPASIDMTANVAPMTVTGYIGAVADGKVVVSDYDRTVRILSNIDKGQFTVKMPSTMTSAIFDVEASKTAEDMDYGYTASRYVTGISNGSVVNVAVTGDGTEVVDEDATFIASITSASFQNGYGTVTVSIDNKSSKTMTYIITSGSAWSLTKVSSVTVAAGSASSITVNGVYDDDRVAVGSEGMTVIVSNASGSESKTLRITENSAASVGNKGVLILTPGSREGEHEGALDKVSASEYMYAITIVNLDDYAKQVVFTVPEVSGWSAVISDEYQNLIRDSGDSFTLYGLETAVYYVKFMPNMPSGSSVSTVPSSTVGISVDGVSQSPLNLSPKDISVSLESMDASGDNIYNSRSGVPVGIWFLLAVGILMLIAVFWLGSKRGVFSRR